MSKAFEKREAEILSTKLNEVLNLKVAFKRRTNLLVRESGEHQRRRNGRGMSRIARRLFGDMITASRAELEIARRQFMLRIASDRVIVEVGFDERSRLSAFYLNVYLEEIVSIISEVYAAAGKGVSFVIKEVG